MGLLDYRSYRKAIRDDALGDGPHPIWDAVTWGGIGLISPAVTLWILHATVGIPDWSNQLWFIVLSSIVFMLLGLLVHIFQGQRKQWKSAHKRDLKQQKEILVLRGEDDGDFNMDLRDVIKYVHLNACVDEIDGSHSFGYEEDVLQRLNNACKRPSLQVQAYKEGTIEPVILCNDDFREMSIHAQPYRENNDVIGAASNKIDERGKPKIDVRYRHPKFKRSQIRTLFPRASDEQIQARMEDLIVMIKMYLETVLIGRKMSIESVQTYPRILSSPPFRRIKPQLTDEIVRAFDPDDPECDISGGYWLYALIQDVRKLAHQWHIDEDGEWWPTTPSDSETSESQTESGQG